jgi:glycosyltransferase involved in cell wall biosynthesis
VDWKAVDVVIRALKAVPLAEFGVIGDGPMLEVWRNLAEELGIQDRVHFAGWLPQEECAARLQSSLALVLPSIYECGGAVVLESMAMGKPVIATRWGGPVDYLDESSGMLIEPKSYPDLAAGFADAMTKLMNSPELATSMGAAGHKRAVRDFDWQKKIQQVISIYRALEDRAGAAREHKESSVPPPIVAERR